MTLALVGLAAAGLVISSYFTAVAYRWMRPDARWIPRFCRLGEETCASIVFTPEARVLGVPNSLLGQIYYVSLLAGAPAGALDLPWLGFAWLAASLLTVGLGAYLTWSLLFVTRVACVLCFTSHAINAVIFGLLVLRTGTAGGP